MKKIDVNLLSDNVFKNIGEEWMLITAGNKKEHNMMTASWGFMGVMWHKPCAIAAISPQRYTMKFVEKEEFYTLSFYGDNKKLHSVCGKQSGRDINKTEVCGLTPIEDEETGAVYFKEARLVLICKKKYMGALKEDNFIDKSIVKDIYPTKDFHNMIIGEIVKAYINE